MKPVVAPRSIFLDSKLRKDFGGGRFAPLTDATLYGEDLGQAKVSGTVAGTIAKSLSGVDAYDVLSRMMRNTTNVLVYSYVEVTSYVVLMDLPVDVVKILPWASVSIGPTGAMGLGQLLHSFFPYFTAPVKAVLAYLDGWKADIVRAARNLDQIARTFDGSPASAVRLGAAIGELLAAVFRPDIILLLTVMSFAMIAAVTATIATGIGYLIVSQVVPMIISLIVSVVVQAVAPAASSALSWVAKLVATREWKFMGVAIAAFDLAIACLAQFGGPIRLLHVERVMDPTVPDAFKTSYGETINPVKTSRALIMAIIGFTLAVIPALVALPETAALLLDVISLGFGIVALYEAVTDPARVLYAKLTAAISGIEVGVSALGVVGHMDGAARGE